MVEYAVKRAMLLLQYRMVDYAVKKSNVTATIQDG